ncbi:MAG: hypothetical protein ABI640_18730 [Gammaproteobacteria bacterium]
MHRAIIAIGLSIAGLHAAAADPPLAPEMNVTQGPETVFSRSPTDIFPALAGAQRTKEAGRVGKEMVFWIYQQRNGARVLLFACAPVGDVDCEQRTQAVCSSAKVLEMQTATGNIVRRSCRAVRAAAPGDTHPGCDDREEMAPLSIGLLSCG